MYRLTSFWKWHLGPPCSCRKRIWCFANSIPYLFKMQKSDSVLCNVMLLAGFVDPTHLIKLNIEFCFSLLF